jgi:hypothetical protein
MDQRSHPICQSSILNVTTRRNKTLYDILLLLATISLACGTTVKSREPVSQGEPMKPTSKPLAFEKTDCSVAGITFPDITVSYVVDDNYDGPYLICHSSSQGSHGSIGTYFSVMAYKTDKLETAYNELQASIQGFVDQSNEWNADPNLPEEIKDNIDFIQKSTDQYTFVISSYSNVQNCYRGRGYGAEKYLDKYLIHLSLESCELGDANAYRALLISLEKAAYTAIYRVEGVSIP